MSTSYCTKRTAPETYGIFERGKGRDLFPVVDGLTFEEATSVVRRAATDPGFNPVDHFDCFDDSYDAAEAEAEMYAEFGMSWIAGGGSRHDVGRAWAEYSGRWNGVELVDA